MKLDVSDIIYKGSTRQTIDNDISGVLNNINDSVIILDNLWRDNDIMAIELLATQIYKNIFKYDDLNSILKSTQEIQTRFKTLIKKYKDNETLSYILSYHHNNVMNNIKSLIVLIKRKEELFSKDEK